MKESIEFTNNINTLIERQNILIKLWDNPNIEKYSKLIKKINKNTNNNNDIRKNVINNPINKIIMYSNIIFIIGIILFSSLIWYLGTETKSDIILFIKHEYSSWINFINKLTNTNAVYSHAFLVGFLLYIIISVFHTGISSLSSCKTFYKLSKIKTNTLDSLTIANKLIVKSLVKRKGILSKNSKLIKTIKKNSPLDFVKDNSAVDEILSYIEYLKFFLDFSENKSSYYFPEFEQVEGKPNIIIPSSKNIILLTENCILLKDSYPLVESIVLSQTVGISFIDNLKFTIFDKVIQVHNYKETSISNSNSLIVLKNLGYNTSIKDIVQFSKKMEELGNYVIIVQK